MAYLGKKRWKILDQNDSDPINQILLNRKIPLLKKESFLKPDFKSGLYDPFLIKNMDKSVERIIQAVKKGEKIGIFADYDADGVTSATLLFDSLSALNLDSFVYIPARDEGYGINQKGIDLFAKNGISLLIAVDMGITGRSEIEYAKSLGLDSIVIDHHLVQSNKLPTGLVINPHQKGDKYPFKTLSACGLVYKFACAISTKFPDKISSSQLKWWLDLVAISTIADMVPLIDENRVLTHFGLIVLKKTKRLGLLQLYQAAGLDTLKVSPGVVGFQIAPRLNAPGRIKHANLAFALLTAKDKIEAVKLSRQIQEVNINRQEELERILTEARKKVISEKLNKNKVILISGQGWQPGLVGLVAGRLMEEFARPAIVMEKGELISRGSARSIAAFHLLDAFEYASKYLSTFGGHARAGGLSLENKHLSSLYELLLEYAEGKIQDDDLIPELTIDVKLKSSQITFDFANQLNLLEPFGFGNPKPLFLLEKQEVNKVDLVGKNNQHLKYQIGDWSAIQFDGGKMNPLPKKGDIIDILFSIQINTWNNNQNIELNISDWKQANQ